MNYKKLIATGILICVATSFSGCGIFSMPSSSSVADPNQPVIVFDSDNGTANSEMASDVNAATETESNSSDLTTDQAKENSESDTLSKDSVDGKLFDGDLSGVIATGTAKGVIYSSDSEHISHADDDGTEYFTADYQIPSVEIKDSVPASAAINNYLSDSAESFVTSLDIMSAEALSFYEIESLEDESGTFAPYEQTSSFEPARLDSRLVSLRERAYQYTGGAHGTTALSGYNFDARTGNLITLSSLSIDSDKFLSSAKDYIASACKALPEDYALFDGYEASISSMFSEGNWYATKDGIVFIASEYLLAPYSTGILQFEVPYSQLESFNEAYLPE